jgi:hypothetical protein
VPPQSIAVSKPFFTPSVQLGSRQIPPEHTPEVQSRPFEQPSVGAQAGHVPPPQSGPVSPPFRTPSWHVGVWHVPLAPQTPDWQSSPESHAFPSPQPLQTPPQSTSVSFASRALLRQVTGRQTPPSQIAEAQSALTAQPNPSPHFPHVAPPQSMSVSVPSWISSVQVASRQVLSMHAPDAQSVGSVHASPVAHGGQDPPQSIAVSVPFFT